MLPPSGAGQARCASGSVKHTCTHPLSGPRRTAIRALWATPTTAWRGGVTRVVTERPAACTRNATGTNGLSAGHRLCTTEAGVIPGLPPCDPPTGRKLSSVLSSQRPSAPIRVARTKNGASGDSSRISSSKFTRSGHPVVCASSWSRTMPYSSFDSCNSAPSNAPPSVTLWRATRSGSEPADRSCGGWSRLKTHVGELPQEPRLRTPIQWLFWCRAPANPTNHSPSAPAQSTPAGGSGP